MQIGQLQQAEAFEGRRQTREIPLHRDQTDVQKIFPGERRKTCEGKAKRDEGVERKDPLQPEYSFSLVQQPGGFFRLFRKSPREKLAPHSCFQSGVVLIFHSRVPPGLMRGVLE